MTAKKSRRRRARNGTAVHIAGLGETTRHINRGPRQGNGRWECLRSVTAGAR